MVGRGPAVVGIAAVFAVAHRHARRRLRRTHRRLLQSEHRAFVGLSGVEPVGSHLCARSARRGRVALHLVFQRLRHGGGRHHRGVYRLAMAQLQRATRTSIPLWRVGRRWARAGCWAGFTTLARSSSSPILIAEVYFTLRSGGADGRFAALFRARLALGRQLPRRLRAGDFGRSGAGRSFVGRVLAAVSVIFGRLQTRPEGA